MPECLLCSKKFPVRVKLEGQWKNFQRRKFCLECSPFNCRNTRDLTKGVPKLAPGEAQKNWQKRIKKKRKIELAALLGGKCEICGYNKCLNALDFHHKDPGTKKFTLSTHGLHHKWEELVEEVKKCMLLCKNCHAELHAGFHSTL